VFGKAGIRPPVAFVAALLALALIAACGSGSSESGSEQFRDQTDSATLDFGEEGSETQREEATDAVQGYLTARAAADWPAACSQLSRSILAKIEHLATSATELEDESCPSFLGAFTQLSAKYKEDIGEVDAGSLRQRGEQGYLIYYGADEVVYAMPLSREGDVWKVSSLTPEHLS
jgi:hypothetical protein